MSRLTLVKRIRLLLLVLAVAAAAPAVHAMWPEPGTSYAAMNRLFPDG